VVFLVLIAFLAVAGILIDFQACGRRSDQAFFWFADVLRAVTFLGKIAIAIFELRVLVAMAQLVAE
jgi:hypothetical protein